MVIGRLVEKKGKSWLTFLVPRRYAREMTGRHGGGHLISSKRGEGRTQGTHKILKPFVSFQVLGLLPS